MRVLTLDLGLGSLKVCLWDGDALSMRRAAAIETQVSGDRAEQDASQWWDAAVSLTRNIVAEAGNGVDVIGVTGHMHALVPTDAEGNALAPVPVVSDRRARAACRELENEFGIDTLLRWTGGRLDPTSALAKVRHFFASGDAAWQSARWLLPPKDWLRLRLTGQAATDPIDAAGTMLWDIRRNVWQPDILRFVGCGPNVLPPVLPTVSVAGTLTHAAADALGLRPGTPVATGGGDDIEAFGAGALFPGEIYEHLGTTGSIYAVSPEPFFDPEGRVETYPDVLPGHWLVGGSTSAAGLAQRWMLALLGQGEDWTGAEARFARMAEAGTPADAVFLPYLAGERAPLWDGDRRGALLGLRSGSDAETVLQATAEGILFSLRSVLAVLEESGVVSPQGRVYTSGPFGAGAALGQVRADVYGRETVRCTLARDAAGDTTSVAARILAACALSGANPYAEAKRLRTIVWTAAPRSDRQPNYNRAYRRFRRAAELLAAWDAAAEEEP